MKAKKRRKMPFKLRLKIVFGRINGVVYRFRYSLLKRPPEYKRKSMVSIHEVMNIIGNEKIRSNNKNHQMIIVNGEEIRINNSKMRRFCMDYREHGKITCKQCGMEASMFAVEKQKCKYDIRWQLNLYGISNGKNILFTLDHIIPMSKGGSKKSLENHETLCRICNENKSNKIISNGKGKKTVR